MKVLVSTSETQGQRGSDFYWMEPEELAPLDLCVANARGEQELDA